MPPAPTETRSAFPAVEADLAGAREGTGIPRISDAPAFGEPAAAPVEADAQSLADTKRQFWTVCGSHVVVDIYPIFFAALQIALADHLKLTGWQIGVIYASNQILSGLPQALAAWLSDRHDTRIAGPLGLTVSCVCSCLIGLAPNFWVLWLLLSLAMIGNGIYHPIAGAQAGQLGGQVLKTGRSLAVSLFFAAGMVGSVIGPIVSTRLNQHYGLPSLLVLVPMGLVMAFILHKVTSHVSHRTRNGHSTAPITIPDDELLERWKAVKLLYCGNALRFIVNTAMYVLFNIWAERQIPGNPAAATNLSGNIIVAMTIGMGVGAILAGRLIRPGTERWAIFSLSMAGAVFTALTGYAGSQWGLWPMYVCAALTSVGFSSILPITIGLAQRLLPHRTGLASSLMMGGSWAIAAVAPVLVGAMLGPPVEPVDLPAGRLELAFVGFGVILLAAGALALMMPEGIIRRVGSAK
ncbi:MAG: MFS transporter [Phycisphaerales bacterium]